MQDVVVWSPSEIQTAPDACVSTHSGCPYPTQTPLRCEPAGGSHSVVLSSAVWSVMWGKWSWSVRSVQAGPWAGQSQETSQPPVWFQLALSPCLSCRQASLCSSQVEARPPTDILFTQPTKDTCLPVLDPRAGRPSMA